MKALWCIGLAACLLGRTAAAQRAWEVEEGHGHADPHDPDLVRRFQLGAALNRPDLNTHSTPGPKGYNDYPALP